MWVHRHVGASACGRGGMWARRLFAPLEQQMPGRLLFVLSRSLCMVLLTLMVAAVTAVVTLAMTLVAWAESMAEREGSHCVEKEGRPSVQIDSRTGVVIAVSCGLCLDLQQIVSSLCQTESSRSTSWILVSGRHGTRRPYMYEFALVH